MGADGARDAQLSTSGWAALCVTALALNLAWEPAHAALYTCELSPWRHLRAAGGDVVLITAAVIGARRIAGGSDRSYWAVLVGLLAGTAVTVELTALHTGRWAYAHAMPRLGPLGLSPLAQLPVTGGVAMMAARRLNGPRREPADST